MPGAPNFSVGAVANNPGAAGLIIEVQAGQGARFAGTPPASGPPYVATVRPTGEPATPGNAEVVTVIAVAGDKLTVERQAENSAARNIKAGDAIFGGTTEGLLRGFRKTSQLAAAAPIPPEWKPEEVVNAGEVRTHAGETLMANPTTGTSFTTGATFGTGVNEGWSLQGLVPAVKHPATWTSTHAWRKRAIVEREGLIWEANEDIAAKAAWDPAKWTNLGITLRHESVWLQEHGVQVGTENGDQSAKCQAAADHAGETRDGATSSISGDPGDVLLGNVALESLGRTLREYTGFASPYNKVYAHLHLPKNTSVHGRRGHNELTFLLAKGCNAIGPLEKANSNSRGYGIALNKFTAASKAVKVLDSVEVTTQDAAPNLRTTTKQVPNLIDLVLAAGPGSIWKSKVYGAVASGILLDCDHFTIFETDIGGWAKLRWATFKKGGGNILVYNCAMVSGFCAGYVEPGAAIGGTSFVLGHWGFSNGPCIYKAACEQNGETFMAGVQLDRVTIEEPARGVFVDDSMESKILKVKVKDTLVSSGGTGPLGGRVRGDVTQPSDAIVKCGGISELTVDGHLFTNSGFEPGTGCCVRASGTVNHCDFGDITEGLKMARALGLPFMRAGGQEDNKANMFDAGGTRLQLAFRTVLGPPAPAPGELPGLPTSIAKYDLLRKVTRVEPNVGPVLGNATIFDSPGALPEGFAMQSATVGPGEEFHMPVAVVPQPIRSTILTRLAHLGTGTADEQTVSTKPTATANFAIGSSGGTLKALTNGFPPTGEFTTGAGTLTYTGITPTEFTGVANPGSKAIEVKTSTSLLLVQWPLNPRGQTTTLVAPLDLGTGATPPLFLRIAQMNTEKIKAANLSSVADFPLTGGVAYAGGSLFHYKKGVPIPTTALASETGADAHRLQILDAANFPAGATYEAVKFQLTGQAASKWTEGEFTISFTWKGVVYTTELIKVFRKVSVIPPPSQTLGAYTLPAAGGIVEASSTAGFPATNGWIQIGNSEPLKYTKISGNIFEGVTGGTGTYPAGSAITVPTTSAEELAAFVEQAEGPAGQELPVASVAASGGATTSILGQTITLSFQGGLTGLVRDLTATLTNFQQGNGVSVLKEPLGLVRLGAGTQATYAGVKNSEIPTTTTVGAEVKVGDRQMKVASIAGLPARFGAVRVVVGGVTQDLQYASAEVVEGVALIKNIAKEGEVGAVTHNIPIGTTVKGFPELTDVIMPVPNVPKGAVVLLEGSPAELRGLSGGTAKGGVATKAKLLRAAQVNSLLGFSANGGAFRIEPEAGKTVTCYYQGVYSEPEAKTRYIGPEAAANVIPAIVGVGSHALLPGEGTALIPVVRASPAGTSNIEVHYTGKSEVTTALVAQVAFPLAEAAKGKLEVTTLTNLPTRGWLRFGNTEIQYTGTETSGGKFFLTGVTEGNGTFAAATVLSMETLTGCTLTKGAASTYKIKPGAAIGVALSTPRNYLVGVSCATGFTNSEGVAVAIASGKTVTDLCVFPIAGSSGYPAGPASVISGNSAQIPYEMIVSQSGGEVPEETTEEPEGEEEPNPEFNAEAQAALAENLIRAYLVVNNNSLITGGPPQGKAAIGGTVLTAAVTKLLTGGVTALQVSSIDGFRSSGWLRIGAAEVHYNDVADLHTRLTKPVTLGGTITINVQSTEGFPATNGFIKLGTTIYKYAKTVVGKFEGVETGGASGTIAEGSTVKIRPEFLELSEATLDLSFVIGQPVTPAMARTVTADQVVRARFSASPRNSDGDKGVLEPVSGPGDTAGYKVGSVAGPDEGGVVVIEI
jgi:hypothetical protein